MGEYTLKPDVHVARQFTGGFKNFKKLRKWLLEHDDSMVVSWIPKSQDEPCSGKTDERIVIAYLGQVHALPVGKWIVFEKPYPGHRFVTYYDEDFKAIYQKKDS